MYVAARGPVTHGSRHTAGSCGYSPRNMKVVCDRNGDAFGEGSNTSVTVGILAKPREAKESPNAK